MSGIGMISRSSSTSSLNAVSPRAISFRWPEPKVPRARKEACQLTEREEIDYLRLILNARVYDVAIESPLQLAKGLSRNLGNNILLKREDMQPVFSFKCRGAFNRMFQLSPEERARGVIAVSAGNHAQGVALAAQKLGIKATICMPVFAPEIKVESVRRLGGDVVLCGNDFDEAKVEMLRLAKERGLIIIPPFDDPHVIAGQGTVGVEILRQVRQERLDAIFICVGGGGLLAGVAAYVKSIRPDVRVIGVNTIDSHGMYASLQKGEHVTLSEVGLFSDGSAVRVIGKETFRLCNAYVDDMVLVSTDEICAAIKDTFDDTRSIVEPAGAVSVAGCKKFLKENPQLKDGVFACVLSGANMNFDRLRFVAERARLGEEKEAFLSVIIPEQPGAFWRLYSAIYPRNITEFSYRYSDPRDAYIFCGFEVTRGKAEVAEVMARIESDENAMSPHGTHEGVRMRAMDISDNEMAKSHGRYLIGGRSSTVTNEQLYRFQFPERPGALKRFLSMLESGWNVSLFHYRNHGADVGRVMVGMQVPPESEAAFQKFLERLGYPYVCESNNPVYLNFLK